MDFWLQKPGVLGFRISTFNYLFEDWEFDEKIVSDVEKTMEFLDELRELADGYASDGFERLFLLEMVELDGEDSWSEIYLNQTLEEAVISFRMDKLPWEDG